MRVVSPEMLTTVDDDWVKLRYPFTVHPESGSYALLYVTGAWRPAARPMGRLLMRVPDSAPITLNNWRDEPTLRCVDSVALSWDSVFTPVVVVPPVVFPSVVVPVVPPAVVPSVVDTQVGR